jgi:hypothetical protein
MKDAVAVDRATTHHQDSLPFGIDQHKTAFEPLRVPPPPAPDGTNGLYGNMADDADALAVRTALEKLSVEEQVSAVELCLPFRGVGDVPGQAPGASNMRASMLGPERVHARPMQHTPLPHALAMRFSGENYSGRAHCGDDV